MVSCRCCYNDNETYSENGIVSERHYGCYRFGIIIAIVIVVVLIIGTVPVFATTKNSQLILIVTIVTVLVVGVIIFVYFEWQHRKALTQRERCRDQWVVQSRVVEQVYRPELTTPITRTSWLFWNSGKNENRRRESYSAPPPPRYSDV